LNYTKGVDIVADTIDVAMHFGYVQNPAQGTFTLVNPDTGEAMVDENGKDIKIRGRKNLTDFFRQDLRTWKKVYDLCEDKLKQKDDPYIKSFEEMLNINLNEKIGIDLSVSEEI
jgi:hypothetical protein